MSDTLRILDLCAPQNGRSRSIVVSLQKLSMGITVDKDDVFVG